MSISLPDHAANGKLKFNYTYECCLCSSCYYEYFCFNSCHYHSGCEIAICLLLLLSSSSLDVCASCVEYVCMCVQAPSHPESPPPSYLTTGQPCSSWISWNPCAPPRLPFRYVLCWSCHERPFTPPPMLVIQLEPVRLLCITLGLVVLGQVGKFLCSQHSAPCHHSW